VTAEFVIGAYHQLFEVHLTIVFAALAVSRRIEHQTGWSIRKFVRTARRYRTIAIQGRPAHHYRRLPTSSAKPSKRSTAPAGYYTSVVEVGKTGQLSLTG
jgi:hypothetical protein